MKTVYAFTPEGLYCGQSVAFESPLEPGTYHLPAFTTEVEPPITPEGKVTVWDGETWGHVDAPAPPEPDIAFAANDLPDPEPPPAPPEPTREETIRRTCAARLATVFGNGRESLNHYINRLSFIPASQRTAEQKADIATYISLDLWEETMLEARDAAITSGDDPLWLDPPDGGAALVAACI